MRASQEELMCGTKPKQARNILHQVRTELRGSLQPSVRRNTGSEAMWPCMGGAACQCLRAGYGSGLVQGCHADITRQPESSNLLCLCMLCELNCTSSRNQMQPPVPLSASWLGCPCSRLLCAHRVQAQPLPFSTYTTCMPGRVSCACPTPHRGKPPQGSIASCSAANTLDAERRCASA